MFLEISLPSLNPAPEFTSKPMDDQVAQNDIEITEMKLEQFNSEYEIVNDIEIIEIKIEENSEELFYKIEADAEDGKNLDIANIPVSEDFPKELVVSCSDSEYGTFEYDKLDDEEMAIMVKDLQTTTSGYEHLTKSSNTVVKPKPTKVQKNIKTENVTIYCLCGKSYVSRTTYVRHLLQQHNKHSKYPIKSKQAKPFDDRAQEKITATKSEIEAPKEVPEEEERTIEMCHICGKIFRNKSTYRQHVRDQHNPNGVKPQKRRASRMCELCGKICSGGTFREHMRKHTNPESVTCEHCGQLFSFVSVLKSHIQVRHTSERPYKCTQCSSSFKRADYLRSHMRYKHEPKILRAENSSSNEYKCEDCQASFRTAVALGKHRNLRETVAGQLPRCPISFKCPICDLSFKKRNYLVLHKRYVHEKNQPFRISEGSVGPYKCDKCERRFASVCGRNYHCKHTHGTVFNTKFNEVCDHCGLTFRNRVFYAKHCAKLRVKPTCYLCWNAFETQDELKEHIHEVHIDDLPFLCQTCNNRFVTLRQLNDHIRSKHELIRPFKCDYCQHTAVRKDSLEVHIRSCHLGQKPYKCDICDKAFSQASDVRKHRIIHTRNKSNANSGTTTTAIVVSTVKIEDV